MKEKIKYHWLAIFIPNDYEKEIEIVKKYPEIIKFIEFMSKVDNYIIMKQEYFDKTFQNISKYLKYKYDNRGTYTIIKYL